MQVYILNSDEWFSDYDEPRHVETVGVYKTLDSAKNAAINYLKEDYTYHDWYKHDNTLCWSKETHSSSESFSKTIWSHTLYIVEKEISE